METRHWKFFPSSSFPNVNPEKLTPCPLPVLGSPGGGREGGRGVGGEEGRGEKRRNWGGGREGGGWGVEGEGWGGGREGENEQQWVRVWRALESLWHHYWIMQSMKWCLPASGGVSSGFSVVNSGSKFRTSDSDDTMGLNGGAIFLS